MAKIKPSNVKIISIAVAATDATVFGLGEDGNVYCWSNRTGKWELHKL